MAKNGNRNTVEGSPVPDEIDPIGATDPDDEIEDVSGRWARGMINGEAVSGRYLGYDTVMIRGRAGMEPRKRHVFVEAFSDRSNAKTGEIERTVGMGQREEIVLFGAASLDNDLAASELGSRLKVVRIGKVEGQQRIAYTVGRYRKAPVDTRGVMGRNDPQSSNGPPQGWNGRTW